MKSVNKKFKKYKIYKNEKLNKAGFVSYDLNLYRAYLFSLSEVNELWRRDFGTVAQHKFIISAKDLSKRFGIHINTCYVILKKAAHIFIKSNIKIEDINSKDISFINFCEKTKYKDRNGELHIELTRSIIPYLQKGAKRYVLYSVEDLKNFKSLYSVRLFELLQGFKYTGVLVVSVEKLRVIFNVGPKFSKYWNFKSRTFIPAIKEINKHYPNLKLNVQEITELRKVKKLKFCFVPYFKKGICIEQQDIPALQTIPDVNEISNKGANITPPQNPVKPKHLPHYHP